MPPPLDPLLVTFHLFCFAVLHKNPKKLEVLYVVTSLLIPAGIASVPLITQSYGANPSGTLCYIYASNISLIERLINSLGWSRNYYPTFSVHSHGRHGDKANA